MSISEDKVAELQVKRLEMVQAIISRIANYGATLKNYCITLTTAVCGFAVTLQRPFVVFLALLPIILFALLDAQFLRVERSFRALFDQFSKEEWGIMPHFTLDTALAPRLTFWPVLFSWSILAFYIPLGFAVTIVGIVAGHIYGHFI
jgi:hypothetical protein